MIADLPSKRSPVVTWTLYAGFLLSSGLAFYQNSVIRERTETLVQFENDARRMARSYESASLRASMALAAYDRCRGLRVVAAP